MRNPFVRTVRPSDGNQDGPHIDARRTRVIVDGRPSRVLAIDPYASGAPGWLADALAGPYPSDLALHIRPTDRAETVRMLDRNLVAMQSARGSGPLPGATYVDPRYDSIVRIRDAIEQRGERLFQVAAYVRAHAATLADLDAAEERISGALGDSAGVRAALSEQAAGLMSVLPAGGDYLGRVRNVDSATLIAMLPLAAAAGPRPGYLFGADLSVDELIVVDPFSRERPNKLVLAGAAGPGGRRASRVDCMRALLAGIPCTVVADGGGWDTFAASLGGRTFRLGAPGAPAVNPLDPSVAGGAIGAAPLLGGLLAAARPRSDRGGYVALARAVDAVMDGGPADMDRLAAACRAGGAAQLADDLLGLASGPLASAFAGAPLPTAGALDVIDVSAAPAPARPYLMRLAARRAWSDATPGQRRLILLPDANAMLTADGGHFLAALARRAGERGAALTATFAGLDALGAADGAPALAQQCSLRIALAQDAGGAAQAAAALGLTPDDAHFLAEAGDGSAVLQVGSSEPMLMHIDPSPLEAALADGAHLTEA